MSLEKSEVSRAALGRWRDILANFGLSDLALSGRHGPCPSCGGKDRFRFDDRDGRGTWICGQCGAGDGFELMMRVGGWRFDECLERVNSAVGTAEYRHSKPRQTEDERKLALTQLWQASTPLVRGDLVSRYLHGRGLKVGPLTAPLRFLSAKNMMVAMVSGRNGKGVTLHRTYLDPLTGRKADIEAPRKMMPGSITEACSIRLGGEGPVIGVAEGIETALSAAQMWDIPVWAAINASMMEKWLPPEGQAEVMIFADNDFNFHGQMSAYTLANKLLRLGVRCHVEVPLAAGTDFNDYLMGENT